jgi:Flp pilus assembly pilin Flp
MLTTIVEMTLIFVYVSVLVIKSCDMSSLKASHHNFMHAGREGFRDDESVATAICETYGLGSTSSGGQQYRIALNMNLSCLNSRATKYLPPSVPALVAKMSWFSFSTSGLA